MLRGPVFLLDDYDVEARPALEELGRHGEAEDARADHDQICPRPLHRLIMGSKAPKRALAPRREPFGEWSRRGSNP